MALILSIETSTPVCSVALALDGKILGMEESFDEKSHATQLTVFIQSVLEKNRLQASDLDAISVSKGPGSYTGLRIGVSVAKGICYATQKPLLAINTMKVMTLMAQKQVLDKQAFLCPLLDARRMEVYSAIFSPTLEEIEDVKAEVIDSESFHNILEQQSVYFFGNGAEKCKPVIQHPNARFIDGIYPSAQYMASLAEEAYRISDFKNVAYFEPFYLKDFVATVPKNKIW